MRIQIEDAARVLYLNGPVLFEDDRFSSQKSVKTIDLTTTETEFTLVFITELASPIFGLFIVCLLFTLVLLGAAIHRRKRIVIGVRQSFNCLFDGCFPIQCRRSDDGLRITVSGSNLRTVLARDDGDLHITIPKAFVTAIITLLCLGLLYAILAYKVSEISKGLLPADTISFLIVAYLAFNGILIFLLLLTMRGRRWSVAGCRNILAGYLEDTERERAEERERETQCIQKYPRLCAVPLIGKFFRWAYTQTWVYCILLLSVILVGFGLRLQGLGAMEFREDEYQVIEAAYGYLQSGSFYRWDFLTHSLSTAYYDRAWPHTLMIGESFRWFGFSEWSARLPSLIFGTLLIPLSYFIGKHATDRKILGLALAVVVAFNTNMVNLSQYARMYVVFLPVFVLGGYLLFRGLDGRSPWRFDNVSALKWIVLKFDFDYRYLIAAGIVLVLSCLIHVNTLTIGVGVFAYALIMAICSREERYTYLSGLLSAILVAMGIGYISGVSAVQNYLRWIDIFAPLRPAYFSYLFDYPFGLTLSIFLLVVLLVAIVVTKNRSLLFYLCCTLAALTYFAFFSDRYAGYMYISNYVVFAWLLLLSALAVIAYVFAKMKAPLWQIVFFAIILVAIFTPIVGTPGVLSEGWRPIDGSCGHFWEGYAELNEGYRSGDLLMGQYLRTPYITITDDLTYISLKNNKEYDYREFLDVIMQHDRIWVTWETRKSYHLQPEIIQFIDSHFEKIHGKGIDGTNVELYLWDRTDTDCTF